MSTQNVLVETKGRVGVLVKRAVGFVQHLHHADEHFLVVDERQREHATRVVPRRLVDA